MSEEQNKEKTNLPEGYEWIECEVFGGPMLGVSVPDSDIRMINGSQESLSDRAWAHSKQGRPNGAYWARIGVMGTWCHVFLHDGKVTTMANISGLNVESDVREWGDPVISPNEAEYEAVNRDRRAMEMLRSEDPSGLVLVGGKWHCGDNSAFTVCDGWEDDQLADDPADAIISYFGPTHPSDSKPQDT